MNTGRWWEYYLVRYFVGTIVGTLIVIHISTQSDSFLHNVLYEKLKTETDKNIEVSSLILYGFVGLTFCYLASAPILLLHALRSNLEGNIYANYKKFQENLKKLKQYDPFLDPPELSAQDIIEIKRKKKIRCYTNFSILVVIIIIAVTWFFSVTSGNLRFDWILFLKEHWAKSAFWKVTLGIISVIIIFSVQIWYISYQLMRRDIFKFYKLLAYKRARQVGALQSYIESYRHLREHGNAFFIVFFELILGFIYSTVSSVTTAFVYTLLWIIPACVVWFIGSYLEMKFKNN